MRVTRKPCFSSAPLRRGILLFQSMPQVPSMARRTGLASSRNTLLATWPMYRWMLLFPMTRECCHFLSRTSSLGTSREAPHTPIFLSLPFMVGSRSISTMWIFPAYPDLFKASRAAGRITCLPSGLSNSPATRKTRVPFTERQSSASHSRSSFASLAPVQLNDQSCQVPSSLLQYSLRLVLCFLFTGKIGPGHDFSGYPVQGYLRGSIGRLGPNPPIHP